MSYLKAINIAASCLLGIIVFRLASRRAREMHLFDKKEPEG